TAEEAPPQSPEPGPISSKALHVVVQVLAGLLPDELPIGRVQPAPRTKALVVVQKGVFEVAADDLLLHDGRAATTQVDVDPRHTLQATAVTLLGWQRCVVLLLAIGKEFQVLVPVCGVVGGRNELVTEDAADHGIGPQSTR